MLFILFCISYSYLPFTQSVSHYLNLFSFPIYVFIFPLFLFPFLHPVSDSRFTCSALQFILSFSSCSSFHFSIPVWFLVSLSSALLPFPLRHLSLLSISLLHSLTLLSSIPFLPPSHLNPSLHRFTFLLSTLS